jgi:(p)ppGpp synthase/HD superfamily hydrolase
MTYTLVKRAIKFATHTHAEIDQRRKYTNEPYIVHPAAVAKLVQSVEHTPAMVAAAWLHDTVEDTNATLEEIQELFGITVAQYVEMLTDVATPEDGNRAARCRINNIHTGKAFDRVKTIKLADCIDNCVSIARQDPKFAITYFEEKRDLLPYLVGGDEKLYKMLKDILK